MSPPQSWASLMASLLLLASLHQALAGPATYCKPVPSSINWPAQSAWQELNKTVSGKLFADVPPGSVCHPESALFNNATCAFVLSQWTDSNFHANNPISVDYNDDGCLPSPLAPCSAAAYPSYVIHATNASDVQAAVKFASNTGVRLIVKGTGHDLLSRSSGGQSLSIWTHKIVGISVNTSDTRALPYGGVGSVKIAAGSRMFEVYQAVAKHNLTVIAGGDMSVGIGGWVLGGGHSPISSTYGLGADQVLEIEVVTPDGKFLTVNEKSHPDLFWAMRGGGGSTFGVLISVTMKVYPTLPGSLTIFWFNTTSNSDTFWSISTYFTSQVPKLSDKGANGYHYFIPYYASNPPNQAGMIFGGYFFPNKTPAQATIIMDPVITKINTTNWGDEVFVSNYTIPISDFTKFWMTNQPEAVGPSERLGSRLLTRGALTGNQTSLNNALRVASNGTWTLLNHLVAGQGVRNAKIPGGNNSVCPAWRNNTYIHFVTYRNWTPLNQTQKTSVTNELRNSAIEALRVLDPYTGAYVNEADPTEPNWQTTFWGSNYPRLLALKKQYDPKGIFWYDPNIHVTLRKELLAGGNSGSVGSGDTGLSFSEHPARRANQDDEDSLETILTATGRLCLDDGGRWRYHGHSSGPVFLQGLGERFVEQGVRNAEVGAVFTPLQSVPWSPKSPSPPPGPGIALLLPPKGTAQKLVDCALGHGCAVLSFIHRPTFSQLFDWVYETEPENYGIQDARPRALVYSVLGLGCLFLRSKSVDLSSTIAIHEGTKYLAAARSLIDISDCRELISLQALLCVTYILHCSGKMSVCHSYIAAAVAASLQIGLHRSLSSVLDPVEQETRKRVFWAVRNMETYICAILGLPPAINEEDIDQEMPQEVDDMCIAPYGIMACQVQQLPAMTAVNAHTRLVQIFAKILRYVYPVRHGSVGLANGANRPGEYRVSYRRVCEVEHELKLWWVNLPWELSNDNNRILKPLRIQRELLSIAYAHARLILYRPFLLNFSHHTMRNQSDVRAYTYAMACLYASHDVIIGMKNMKKVDMLNGPYWFTIYSTFFAVTSLISYAWERARDEGVSGVLRDAEIGRDILSELGQRSIAAARCSKALEVLFEVLGKKLCENGEARGRMSEAAEPVTMCTGPEGVTENVVHDYHPRPELTGFTGMGQLNSVYYPGASRHEECSSSSNFYPHDAGATTPGSSFTPARDFSFEAAQLHPPSYMDSPMPTAPRISFPHPSSANPQTPYSPQEQKQLFFSDSTAAFPVDESAAAEEVDFTIGSGPSLNPATWPAFDLSRVENSGWGGGFLGQLSRAPLHRAVHGASWTKPNDAR
ncbi:uncharacterized protein Z519_07563 [Cladophialophora bantiana CBS 173.52]|uniref:FAD-binding PCMH-type domain-containing protein n=1 Tax=Cladophialophora bantiana (strain ATCC 10958 / CBS 173.52 / CDC B-1940 / NIH 8579) TaxID=1442370 RepID=A0A0D2ENN2_CLAB1|nr:uncharacterized protein Z519_07563 [Cladophialophora bantiana CBS 173.52]KIW91596.1 hypothetical protein Z519_07563 [Cladophialophora bantiana CBS 173.52]